MRAQAIEGAPTAFRGLHDKRFVLQLRTEEASQTGPFLARLIGGVEGAKLHKVRACRDRGRVDLGRGDAGGGCANWKRGKVRCPGQGIGRARAWADRGGATIRGNLGRSEIVGKPIAFLLMSEGATVSVCHHMTRNLAVHSRQADAVFVAVGKPRLVTGAMIKPGAAVIGRATQAPKI